jgi:hypothetical protein
VSNVRWPKLDRLQGKMVEPAEDTYGIRDPLRRGTETGRWHVTESDRPEDTHAGNGAVTLPDQPRPDRSLPPAPTGKVRMSSAQRREQLIAVGRRIFAEKGLDATSVEEVAARAKVSKPVVYEHFGGKEGLYAVVVDREVRALLTGSPTRSPPATRASCWSRPRWRCWTTSRRRPTASGCWSGSRRWARRPGTSPPC